MQKVKETLDRLESRLLKELFYKNFSEASKLILDEGKLLKFNSTAEWLLQDIGSLSLSVALKQKFINKGITNIMDIVYLKPLRCEDYTLKNTIKDGEYCAVKGIVYSKSKTRRVTLLTVKTENSGFLILSWFRVTPFVRKRLSSLKKGDEVVCEGKIRAFGLKYTMSHPKIKRAEEFKERKETVYPAVSNMRNATIKKTVESAFSKQIDEPYDYLPYTLISKNRLMFLSQTLKYMHKCEKEKEIEFRLKYEEIFLLMLGLKLQESNLKKQNAPKIDIGGDILKQKEKDLCFELTNDQKKVIGEILSDIKNDKPMLRLLQGDVGCGKTVVALFASFAAVLSGYQAAFMAPTQPLASQIFNEAKNFFEGRDISISLLVSSIKGKQNLYKKIETGEVDLVVGTHALLEDNVKFNNLGLIIIDEQHRFGVEQRKNLMGKGVFPHVLIMSATPIPRSLSMVLYSKSSLSTIKEKPKGRAQIKSFHFYQKDRKKAYEMAIEEMKKHHQVYIVAPLIDASENLEGVNDVFTLHKELKTGFLKDFKIGLLHGHMNTKEKEKVVDEFKRGTLDCLVSTTVIEVGINSPNATVMIVENAERFGLSQLHQLRGRIGRSSLESYAVFLTKNNLSDVAKKRMEAILKTNNGFEIAEFDYQLRGSGEIMGIRQHGKDFIYTNIVKDKELIKTVKKDVDKLIKMHYPFNSGLLKMIGYRWQKNINYVYVG